IYTDSDRYMATGNANNLADTEKPGENNGFTAGENAIGDNRLISAGIDYMIPRGSSSTYRGNLDFKSDHRLTRTLRTSRRFMPHDSPDLPTDQRNSVSNRTDEVTTSHSWSRHLGDSYLTISPSASYRTTRSHSQTSATTTTIADDIAINRQITSSDATDHFTDAILSANWDTKFGTGNSVSISLYGDFNYSDSRAIDSDSISFSHMAGLSGKTIRLTDSGPGRNASGSASVSYSYAPRGSVGFGLSTSLRSTVAHSESVSRSLLDGIPDESNSPRSRTFRADNTIDIQIKWSGRLCSFNVSGRASLSSERLSMRRLPIDTVGRRTAISIPAAGANITFHPAPSRNFHIGYKLYNSLPPLIQTIGWENTTNPLYVTGGNPHLRPQWIHLASFNGRHIISGSQIIINYLAMF
ncbi:MAG: hypothetical protein K2M97_05175, partial [Muribaculaceae bacterium]|nr:hypothetical protein [Muribaculaceae bacterium]